MILLALAKADARRAAPRNASCSAPSNMRRVPAPGKSVAAPSSARGRGKYAWCGGRGAGEDAAAISGPIAGVVAVVEVARVAGLGRLLGCNGATLSPPTPL
jgi:hypothetical protein